MRDRENIFCGGIGLIDRGLLWVELKNYFFMILFGYSIIKDHFDDVHFFNAFYNTYINLIQREKWDSFTFNVGVSLKQKIIE